MKWLYLVIILALFGCKKKLVIALSCADNDWEIESGTFSESGGLVYIPTAFTPNGDGLNDVFRPIFPGNVKTQSLTIKKGLRKIRTLSGEDAQWDGTDENNEFCPSGVYKYELQVKENNSNTIDIKGKLSLGKDTDDLSCECTFEDMIDPSAGFVHPTSESCANFD